MHKTLLTAALLALCGLSGTALASEAGQAYIRGEVGQSHVDVDVDGFGSGSDEDTSFALRIGYFINPNLAVEGVYGTLYNEGEGGASARLSALGLGVVAKKNFGVDGNGFFVDARAGVARGEVKAEVTGLGSDSASSTKPYYGVGVGYDFSSLFGMSVNFDRYQGSGDGVDITADVVSLALEARF